MPLGRVRDIVAETNALDPDMEEFVSEKARRLSLR